MEKLSWNKFWSGFGNITGWFKALAIGIRVVVIVAAVIALLWTFNFVKGLFKTKDISNSKSAQVAAFTGSVGQVTLSQPVNVDYVKIADIVDSKQKKFYLGVTADMADNTSEKRVGFEGGILF